MLASVRDYFFVWQLPVLLGYVVLWLLLGGYLLRKPLREHLDRRKATLGHAVVAMLLSGLAAGFAGAVIAVSYVSFVEPKTVAAAVGGLVAVAVAGLVVTFLVLYAMFNLSARQTVRVAAPALGALVLVGAALAAVAGVPAYIARQREVRIGMSQHDLAVISVQVALYRSRFGHYPESLTQLLDEEWLTDAQVRNPASDREVAYFYAPPPPDAPDDRLLACDYVENQRGRGRVVAYVDGRPPQWLTSGQFRQLLAEPVNADFAEGLRSAEGR